MVRAAERPDIYPNHTRGYYSPAGFTLLKPLQADGLVEADKKEIRITALGRLFLRNIAMAFDACLHAQKKEAPRYSMTA